MLEAAKRIISEAFFGPDPYNVGVRRALADMVRPSARPTHPLLTAAIKDLKDLKLRIAALDKPDQAPEPLKINNAFAFGPAKTEYRITHGHELSAIEQSIFDKDLMTAPEHSLSGKPFDYPNIGLNFKAYLTKRGL